MQVEPNLASFARLLHNRPGVLAVRGAVCATRGHVTFAVRRARGLARRGFTAPAMDLTGGIESLMGQGFEKMGYKQSAPTAWLSDPSRALRFRVPCAPLGELLASDLGLTRVDVMWLEYAPWHPHMRHPYAIHTRVHAHEFACSGAEFLALNYLGLRAHAYLLVCSGSVEGGERLALSSLDHTRVSIGILVVEMRHNDAKNNKAIFGMLDAVGFELVRSLPVWGEHIIDNVFLRLAHFVPPIQLPGGGGEPGSPGANWTYQVPQATADLLMEMPRNVPRGANRMVVRGKHCCAPYVVRPARSMLQCMPPPGWNAKATGAKTPPVVTDC